MKEMRVGFIERFKQVLYTLFRRCNFFRMSLKRVYLSVFVNKSIEDKNIVFKEHALDVLKDFTECLDKNNVFYYLAFGSLLGAVREKGFIKHDLDIDIAVWYDSSSSRISSVLSDYGFKLIHSFSVDNDKSALEETYEKNNVSIDVFYLYDAIDQYPYCCDFVKFPDSVDWTMSIYKHGGLLPRRIELPWSKDRVCSSFESLTLFIPQNAHDLLRMRYGDDYMIPNPKWENKLEHPHIIDWKDKIGLYTSY